MEKSNFIRELERFLTVASMRGATIIFFVLVYEAFHNNSNIELFLLCVSIYIFILAIIIANITNYCLVNSVTFSIFSENKANYVFFFAVSIFLGIYNPILLLVFGAALNVTTINNEVYILKNGNVVLYTFMNSLRFIIAVGVLMLHLTIFEIDIFTLCYIFFICDLVRCLYLRHVKVYTLHFEYNFKIIPFLLKMAPILSMGMGFLLVRTITSVVSPDQYLLLDAKLRLIEICVSLSTLYFVQRFQINLSHQNHDYGAFFTSMIFYIFGILLLLSAKFMGLSLKFLELIEVSSHDIWIILFIGLTVIGCVYGSKLLLKVTGSHGVLFVALSLIYIVLAFLAAFLINDTDTVLLVVGMANFSFTIAMLYLYALNT